MEFVIYLLVIGFAYWLGKRRTVQLLEHEGEGYVRKRLGREFESENFHLLNNVTLDFLKSTTQIDHILVSTSGIFVIETKHYSHWIFGDEKSARWTQGLPGGVKYRFQNPLRQNYKHLKAVQHYLNFIPAELVFPVVVFTGTAEFKKGRPSGVYNPSELVDFIRNKDEGNLSKEQMELAVGRLECARYQISRETDIEHQRNLEQRFGNAT